MYVVETEGLTSRLPEGSTVPSPLSMVTPVAFVEVHERRDDSPFSIAAGVAVSEIVGAAGGGASGRRVSTAAGGGVGCTFFLQAEAEMSRAMMTVIAAENR